MSTPEEVSDSALVARCRAGEEAAWRLLVRRYQRLVFTVPRRAGLSEDQAADVFQMVFSRLFEHLDRIDDPSRVHAWLVTTARRETLRLIDLSRRVVDVTPAGGDFGGGDVGDAMDRFAADAPLPEELLADLQQQDRLARALATLDERTRAFIELLFLQDEPLTYAEVGARLGMAEGSVGPNRARCLDRLRAALRKL